MEDERQGPQAHHDATGLKVLFLISLDCFIFILCVLYCLFLGIIGGGSIVG